MLRAKLIQCMRWHFDRFGGRYPAPVRPEHRWLAESVPLAELWVKKIHGRSTLPISNSSLHRDDVLATIQRESFAQPPVGVGNRFKCPHAPRGTAQPAQQYRIHPRVCTQIECDVAALDQPGNCQKLRPVVRAANQVE